MVFITLTNARALRIGPRIAAQWHRHLGAELLDSLPDTQSRWVLGQWADRAAVLWKRWKCRMATAWKQRVPNDSRRQNESWEYGRSAPLQSLWAPERSAKTCPSVTAVRWSVRGPEASCSALCWSCQRSSVPKHGCRMVLPSSPTALWWWPSYSDELSCWSVANCDLKTLLPASTWLLCRRPLARRWLSPFSPCAPSVDKEICLLPVWRMALLTGRRLCNAPPNTELLVNKRQQIRLEFYGINL